MPQIRAQVDQVGIEEERIVLQEPMADVELEIARRHEGHAGIELGERIVAAEDRKLGPEVGPQPWQRKPGDFLEEVGEVAVKLGIVEERVEVRIADQPRVAAGAAAGQQPVFHAGADDVPGTEPVDRGELGHVERAQAVGGDQAVDPAERPGRCRRR